MSKNESKDVIVTLSFECDIETADLVLTLLDIKKSTETGSTPDPHTVQNADALITELVMQSKNIGLALEEWNMDREARVWARLKDYVSDCYYPSNEDEEQKAKREETRLRLERHQKLQKLLYYPSFGVSKRVWYRLKSASDALYSDGNLNPEKIKEILEKHDLGGSRYTGITNLGDKGAQELREWLETQGRISQSDE